MMSDEEKAVAPPKNDDTDSPANNLVLESPPDSKSGSSQAPNGGFDAWLQVVGAFVLYFNTW